MKCNKRRFTCLACGAQFRCAIAAFLHNFTNHMGVDLGLEKECSICLLRDSANYAPTKLFMN